MGTRADVNAISLLGSAAAFNPLVPAELVIDTRCRCEPARPCHKHEEIDPHTDQAPRGSPSPGLTRCPDRPKPVQDDQRVSVLDSARRKTKGS